DLARAGQLFDVPLEIPLGHLALCRTRQGDVPGDPRVEVFGDAFDRAALAGRVATFEDDGDPRATVAHPLFHLDQLFLEAEKLLLVQLVRDLRPCRAHGVSHTHRL